MRQFLGAVAALLLITTTLTAQNYARIHSRPLAPSAQALDRLNLELAWQRYVPTDGVRDGLFSVHILGDQVITQTHSGLVMALNAETGAELWRTQVGHAYRTSQPLGFNGQSVFAYSGLRLVALDRKTGKVQWEMIMPESPSAQPAADDERIYLATGSGKLYAYEIPAVTGQAARQPAAPKLTEAPTNFFNQQKVSSLYGQRTAGLPAFGALTKVTGLNELVSGPQPNFLWEYRVTGRLENAPLLHEGLVVLADHEGEFIGLTKRAREIKFRFSAAGALAAPLEQYNDMAFVASTDFHMFALNIPLGRIEWRFTTGRAILGKPVATDEDVYVVANGSGMSRLNRSTGQELWRNPSPQRFLAANKGFVYASDNLGRLVILDRSRGAQLAIHDIRDFNVRIRNEVTDRLFLASNDGLLVCLHDPAYPMPFLHRKIVEKTPVEDKAAPAPEKKAPADKEADK
jgi:outer membrane protein assembly factor BamB